MSSEEPDKYVVLLAGVVGSLAAFVFVAVAEGATG